MFCRCCLCVHIEKVERETLQEIVPPLGILIGAHVHTRRCFDDK